MRGDDDDDDDDDNDDSGLGQSNPYRPLTLARRGSRAALLTPRKLPTPNRLPYTTKHDTPVTDTGHRNRGTGGRHTRAGHTSTRRNQRARVTHTTHVGRAACATAHKPRRRKGMVAGQPQTKKDKGEQDRARQSPDRRGREIASSRAARRFITLRLRTCEPLTPTHGPCPVSGRATACTAKRDRRCGASQTLAPLNTRTQPLSGKRYSARAAS